MHGVPIRRSDAAAVTSSSANDISLSNQSDSGQFRSIPVWATLESFQDIDLASEFVLT
jgi:hypothetical protein